MQHRQHAGQVDQAVQALPVFAQFALPPAEAGDRQRVEDEQRGQAEDDIGFFAQLAQQQRAVEAEIQPDEGQEVQKGIAEGVQAERAGQLAELLPAAERDRGRDGQRGGEQRDGGPPQVLLDVLDGIHAQATGQRGEEDAREGQQSQGVGECANNDESIRPAKIADF